MNFLLAWRTIEGAWFSSPEPGLICKNHSYQYFIIQILLELSATFRYFNSSRVDRLIDWSLVPVRVRSSITVWKCFFIKWTMSCVLNNYFNQFFIIEIPIWSYIESSYKLISETLDWRTFFIRGPFHKHQSEKHQTTLMINMKQWWLRFTGSIIKDHAVWPS